MIQRATGPQCLSSRVSALADGSLPDDVRDRALAHVTSCPDCRADLEAEQLIRARLQALPSPRPSARLMASLLAMGEPGGPMPPRSGYVPGMPRPRPATIGRTPLPDAPWQAFAPGRRSTSRSPELPARPGATSRPGGRVTTRRRAVVGATAGAVGVGVIAAALASGLPAAQRVAPPDQLRAAASSTGPNASGGARAPFGIEAAFSTSAAFSAGAASGTSAAFATSPAFGTSPAFRTGTSLGAGAVLSRGPVLTTDEAAFLGGSASIAPWATAPRGGSWFSTGALDARSVVPAVTSTALRHLMSSGR